MSVIIMHGGASEIFALNRRNLNKLHNFFSQLFKLTKDLQSFTHTWGWYDIIAANHMKLFSGLKRQKALTVKIHLISFKKQMY